VYDYVIVGGGNAGCVLAARLTENSGLRVLLLEAGPPPGDADEVRVPSAWNTLLKSPYDWGHATVAQAAADDRRVHLPRGRGLGGTSATDAMTYLRGNRYDYDTWRDTLGCAGWGYADLLPYFRRAEDNERGGSALHGVDGPVRVEDPRYRSPLSRAFVAAARDHGLPGNDDFNGVRQDGVGYYQLTQRRGRRWTTADAYLAQARERENLTVITDAYATRVRIDGARAAGVEYVHRGEAHEAHAVREVLLCAGAIGTPRLLLLSGVGPGEHLRRHDIPVAIELPGVGANLVDQPTVAMRWHTPRVRALWERLGPAQFVRWRVTRGGPMASNMAEAGGFVRAEGALGVPDLQWQVIAAPYVRQGLADPRTRELSVLLSLLNPASRGSVRLRDADPRTPPMIDPAYLAEPGDVARLVDGVRLTREIAARDPLAQISAGETAPGDGIDGDGGLAAWVRGEVATAGFPYGTCAMGPAKHYKTVCDPALRVHGVPGLRVVDASVVPGALRGNSGAPVVAIAERAADLILGRPPLPPDEALAATQPSGRDLAQASLPR
jgi:choline dehydrogenase